ncbi:hypothetical protein [Cucumibacter marinus]|uniref:hypothetical protein n=1 Tax=Cucumibacter marinus TaxID=1121252 RepID=UPI00048D6E41|nr:hypothetical protein [Cucumibacter marinus]
MPLGRFPFEAEGGGGLLIAYSLALERSPISFEFGRHIAAAPGRKAAAPEFFTMISEAPAPALRARLDVSRICVMLDQMLHVLGREAADRCT